MYRSISQIRAVDGLKRVLDFGPKKNVSVPPMRMDIIGAIGSQHLQIMTANNYGPLRNLHKAVVLVRICPLPKCAMVLQHWRNVTPWLLVIGLPMGVMRIVNGMKCQVPRELHHNLDAVPSLILNTRTVDGQHDALSFGMKRNVPSQLMDSSNHVATGLLLMNTLIAVEY